MPSASSLLPERILSSAPGRVLPPPLTRDGPDQVPPRPRPRPRGAASSRATVLTLRPTDASGSPSPACGPLALRFRVMILRNGVFNSICTLILLFLVSPWDGLRGKLCAVSVQRRADRGSQASCASGGCNSRRRPLLVRCWPIRIAGHGLGRVPALPCGFAVWLPLFAQGIRRPEEEFTVVLLGTIRIIFAIPSASYIMLSRIWGNPTHILQGSHVP